MVNFTFLPMSELTARVPPEHQRQFLSIGQLIRWELSDSSGTYTGLMIVGEQATPAGFQTMANMTIDVGAAPLPPDKIQYLSSVVNGEFLGRSVMSYQPGSSRKQ